MPAQTGLTQPIAPQPTFTPRSGETVRRRVGRPEDETAGQGADGPGKRRGRRANNRSQEPGGNRMSRIWQGSLHGGLGILVIAGSAAIGTTATIVTRNQPGSVLGLFVLAGTVAAALTVQPRTGRLIFPVPVLSYLLGALAAGVVYDRSANKTEIAVGAAQWIASGFFVMVLATLLAIALTTVRWFMWRRDRRDAAPPPPPGTQPPRTQPPGTQPSRTQPPGTQPSRTQPPGTQPTQWPPGYQGRWDHRPGPRPDQTSDQRPELRPGSGPYNFSSGA